MVVLVGVMLTIVAITAGAASAVVIPPIEPWLPGYVHFDSSPATVTVTVSEEASTVAYILCRLDGNPYMTRVHQESPGATGTVVVTGLGTHVLEYWAMVVGDGMLPVVGPGMHKTLIVSIGHGIDAPNGGILAVPTVVPIGRSTVLSGSLGNEPSLVGSAVRVWVKKPGRTYWTYSSSRGIYSMGGEAVWWYRYTFRRGMPVGRYYFKATFAGNATYGPWTSTVASVRVR